MELVIHDDIKTQEHIAKIFDKIDEDIKKEEELLKKYQEFKEYHIGKMFVWGEKHKQIIELIMLL